MKLIQYFTVIFIIAIITIILLADIRILPVSIFSLFGLPYGDKIGHFFLMGFLAFLLNICLKNRKVSVVTMDILLGSLIVGIFVTLEEFSQSFFPVRTASIIDLAASYLGILIIGNLSSKVRKEYIDRMGK